ncbi:MAG: 2-hydroxychromene-2-carboxylate isomerase [Pseudomonadota bacterium]
MTQIDYYYSLGSPFTYVAGDRLEKIAAKHGAKIAYKPCDMAHVFSQTGGLPPAKRHPSRQEYRLQELKRLPEAAGMPLHTHPKFWPVDATPASLAVISGDHKGADTGALSRAFLRAVWAEQQNIADPFTIATIVGKVCGTAGGAIVADAPSQKHVFDSNTAEALARGVFGAPFYIVGEERFWGQDRLEYLDRHLASL